MVRDILRFLITLSVIMFLLGLAVGLYVGVRSGIVIDGSVFTVETGSVPRA